MKELIPKEVRPILGKELKLQLDGLVAHARRIQAGRKLLLEEVPALCEIEIDARRAELFKACYGGTKLTSLTELVAHVRVGQDKIYSVDFSDQDYPSLGVQKGFTVRRHVEPQNYDDFLDTIKPEKWEAVLPDTPEFTIVVGTSLHQLMGTLTESPETDNLKKCLDFLKR